MITNAVPRAVRAFGAALRELDVDQSPELDDPAAFGRRAALLAAANVLWHRHVGQTLTTEQVREILGVGTRQAVSDFVKRRRLLAIRGVDGRLLFPAFQFGPSGRPFPAMPGIIDAFAGAGARDATIASWFATPQDLLDRTTPAGWLGSGRDSAIVIEAARRTAGELAH